MLMKNLGVAEADYEVFISNFHRCHGCEKVREELMRIAITIPLWRSDVTVSYFTPD